MEFRYLGKIAHSHRNRSILLEENIGEDFFTLFAAIGSFISRFIETRNATILIGERQ
jgi:hypothetical protein